MIRDYQGNYVYSQKVISEWNSTAIGVYYCGIPTQPGNLKPLYIGKGTGEGGMRARLLTHLRNDNWPDVTHFGYRICDSVKEADDFEASEIKRCQPKYNQVGKTFGRTW
ncbi:MAG: hypothetical protein V1668_03810 [Patescibacteria group bacterium]